MSVKEKLFVFFVKSSIFTFGLCSESIMEYRDNLFLTFDKNHDVFIHSKLYFDFFPFIEFSIGHIDDVFLLTNSMAHSPMEISAHFNVSFLELNLSEKIIGIHLLIDIEVLPGFAQVHVGKCSGLFQLFYLQKNFRTVFVNHQLVYEIERVQCFGC
jgi:hypothetical protein